MARIIFLGTGGGRFSTITQNRATGGIVIQDGSTLHLDPGPGALVHLCKKGIDPMSLDGVLVSHCHPDHYNDAEILVEAMTKGGRMKKGTLAGSLSVMDGMEGFSPAVSIYHQEKVEKRQVLKAGDEFRVRNFNIKATPAIHSDPTTVGFKVNTRKGAVSYTSDTILDPSVINAHKGARVLIMSITRPLGEAIPHHMETGDAITFVDEVRPDLALFTHMGMKFAEGIAEKEALLVEKSTGVRTLAAQDGMVINMNSGIDIEETTEE